MPGVESVRTIAQRVHRSTIATAVFTTRDSVGNREVAAITCRVSGGAAGQRGRLFRKRLGYDPGSLLLPHCPAAPLTTQAGTPR